MMGRVCWIVFVVCFSVVCVEIGADFNQDSHKKGTCDSMCRQLGYQNACEKAAVGNSREEVVVFSNSGSTSNIKAWNWETVTMVAAAAGEPGTQLAACLTHTKGKRFGLRDKVPENISRIIENVQGVQTEFIQDVEDHHRLYMMDHLVFDLLDFFTQLDSATNKSQALSAMTAVLSAGARKAQELTKRETFCVVPWLPPCDNDCSQVRALLGNCFVLIMSPDSYVPTPTTDPDHNGCVAQATLPIAKFLYGIESYISKKLVRSLPAESIVAGIPWHGYEYNCTSTLVKDSKECAVTPSTDTSKCFDQTNRHRRSLAEIHRVGLSESQVHLDLMGQAIYYNTPTTQVWFENFTTLLLKYQLVKDLQLRGLSIWYGEDMTASLTVDSESFSSHSWDFLLHNILHKTVHDPVTVSHFYANTVAGIGVGCLLLGTILGVTFTCIAFKRGNFTHTRGRNRPFKLDEDDDDFRDDEGL